MGARIVHCRRGFMLAEAVVALALVVLIVAVAALGAADSRRRARLGGSIANLQQIGAGAQLYGEDHADRIFSFSWRAGVDYGFGGVAVDDVQAAANQAIDIIRRRSGREDLQPIGGWVPHIWYNYLVLSDYLELPLPSRLFASPENATLLGWQRASPGDFFRLTGYPPNNATARLQYSSSYEMSACSVSPDGLVVTPQGVVPTIAQSPMGHRWYEVGNPRTVLGRRQLSEVRYPAHKALMYETAQRSFGQRHVWFAHERARVPVLLADASAGVRATRHANRGFLPNNPGSPQPTLINYVPETIYEPPTYSGGPTEFVVGRFRWTRSGLRGRDFLGDEVAWVP